MDNGGFRPLKKTTLTQDVVDQLCRVIISGKYKPGDKIPPEQELANMLSCGRNTVREAIKILTSHGVLEIRRTEGTFVSAGMNDGMVNPLIYSSILRAGEDSREDMIEFQISMDKSSVRLASVKRTEEDLKVLEQKVTALKAAISREKYDLEEVLLHDREFHNAIANATHNTFMISIYQYIWELLLEVIRDEVSVAMKQYREIMLKRHENQYFGIRDRDPEFAASAVTPFYRTGARKIIVP